MAEVTAVDTKAPVVKSITLKLAQYEAHDVLTFIEHWYEKYGYASQKAGENSIHKAIKSGLAGKTFPSPVF